MKTTVFFATLLCWELVSSFPFPEQLARYYGSYEPVGVREQRDISQPIQISNLARSQNHELTYQQQQLAYLQDNLRRQNYENLLRNQEQEAALNQRIANQLLIPQPDNNYNHPIPLNAVREPYINSIPLQRPIEQTQFEAPITQQYYQNQPVREPLQPVQAPQPFQVQNRPRPEPTPAVPVQPIYHNNQQYPPVPPYNAQNVLYNPRIQQAIASTPLKKRYLVLHPNGTIEHIDHIDHIVQRHPNYVLVNAGDISKIKGVIPPPVQPVAPVPPIVPAPLVPEVHANATGPVPPVAPLTPVVPTPNASSDTKVSTTPAPTVAPPPPTILNGTDPGPKPTVPPPTGPTTTTKTVTAQSAPQPLTTTLAPVAPVPPIVAAPLVPEVHANSTGPVPPVAPLTPVVPTPNASSDTKVSTTPAPTVAPPPQTILNGTDPGPKPTVPPPTGPTTTTKTVTAQSAPQPLTTTLAPPPLITITFVPPTTTPPVVNATEVYPLPYPTPVTTENPITTPSTVTATATAEYPPPSNVTTLPTPVIDPSVTPSAATTPEVTTECPVTPASENATAIAVPKSPENPAVPTNVTSVEIPSDVVANDTVKKQADLTKPDFPFSKIPTDPIVWFRSTDLNFFDKLTSGNETFDIVYFFNVPREPRVLKDTKTTIHANGTVVEETVETIYDDEDAPPRILKTTKITNPDDAPAKT